MRQKLFTAIAALSLVAFGVTIAFWIGSVDSDHRALVPVGSYGVASIVSNRGEIGVEIIVVLPHWLIAAISGIVPVAWVVFRARRRGSSAGYACVKCGYDLRATPDRCPECGTTAPAAERQPHNQTTMNPALSQG